MYVTASDVYATTSLTSSEVPEASVNSFILAAEEELDAETNTTYWKVEDSGTATSGGSTTLVDTSQTWTSNTYADMYVWVYSGTGSGQVRQISSNTTDTLTVSTTWATNPDNTSLYRVIYTATSPYYDSPNLDGSGTDTFFVPWYPIRIIESLSINSTDVTVSTLYRYDKYGQIITGDDSEKSIFDDTKPQLVNIDYWWGVYPIPNLAKRFVTVLASLKTLASQMGGTYNTPSSYQLPEGQVTIGQAYVNIKGTFDVLNKEYAEIKNHLIKYPIAI